VVENLTKNIEAWKADLFEPQPLHVKKKASPLAICLVHKMVGTAMTKRRVGKVGMGHRGISEGTPP
jgi:hypothetical protein